MEFQKLTLDCISALRPYFENNQCRICDCTIGGTFMWRDFHNSEYAVENRILYLKVEYPVFGSAFAPPRDFDGADVGKEAYERIIAYCNENSIPVRICAASETVKEIITSRYPDAQVRTDRAWSDYLYNSVDIASLAGRKYSGQRNHINRFLREHEMWSFEPIDKKNISQVREFFVKYAEENTRESQAYIEGNSKTLEVLDNFELYGQFGGVLIVDGEIVGASLGERVGDTIYVHVEKAVTSCRGSYPMLVNQFAKMYATDGILYFNREEDDGVEGLRTSKLSYHPVLLLDKFLIEIQ